MYRSMTRQIVVEVEPFYLPDRSNPDDSRYVWGYRVTISNNSDIKVQLHSRHWRITDAAGRVEEVQGEGVVGEQPELNPGDSFQYTSGCPLRTSSGFMQGSYTMHAETGEVFDIDIPTFSLDLPDDRRSLN